ncbi:hypothetical protein, partial [Azospirillum isscasi]
MAKLLRGLAALTGADAVTGAVGSSAQLHGWLSRRLIRTARGDVPPTRPLPRWLSRLLALPMIVRLVERRPVTLGGLWRSWALWVALATTGLCAAVLAAPAGAWSAV